MNEKGRQTKLLAAVAILAMVVCVFAVAMPSEEAEGAVGTNTVSNCVTAEPTTGTAYEVPAAGNYYIPANITTVTIPNTVTSDVNLYLADNSESTTGLSITDNRDSKAINVYVATGAPVSGVLNAVTGLVLKENTANSLTGVVADVGANNSYASIKTGAAVTGSGTLWGISVQTTGPTYTYYAIGSAVPNTQLANTDVVNVIDGSITMFMKEDGATTNFVEITANVTDVGYRTAESTTAGSGTQADAVTFTAAGTDNESFTITVAGGASTSTGTISVGAGVLTYSGSGLNSIAQMLEGYATATEFGSLQGIGMDDGVDAALTLYGTDDADLTFTGTNATLALAVGASYNGTVFLKIATEITQSVSVSATNTTASSSIIVSVDTTNGNALKVVGSPVTGTSPTAGNETPTINSNVVITSASASGATPANEKIIVEDVAFNGNLGINAEIGSGKALVIPVGSNLQFMENGEITGSGKLVVLGYLTYGNVTPSASMIGITPTTNVLTDKASKVESFMTGSPTILVIGAKVITTVADFQNIETLAAAGPIQLGDCDDSGTLTYYVFEIKQPVDLSNTTVYIPSNALVVIGDWTAFYNANGGDSGVYSDFDGATVRTIGDGRGTLTLNNVTVESFANTVSEKDTSDTNYSADGKDSIIVCERNSLVLNGARVFAVVNADPDLVETSNLTSSYINTSSRVTVGYGSTLNLEGDVDTNITVYGNLIVSSNVNFDDTSVMNVYRGATVTIDGNLTIDGSANFYDGSTTMVNGTVTMNNRTDGTLMTVGINPYDGDSNGADFTVSETGTFTLGAPQSGYTQRNTLVINSPEASYTDRSWSPRFVVEGTLDVKGALAGYVYDMGTVLFNGNSIDNDRALPVSAVIVLFPGNSITVTSVTGSMTITDSKTLSESDRVTTSTDDSARDVADGNSVTISNVRNVTVSVSQASATYTNGDKNSITDYYTVMDVSGTITATVEQNGANNIGFSSATGTGVGKNDATLPYVQVSGDLTVGRTVTLNFVAGHSIVSGNISAIAEQNAIVAGSADAKITNTSGASFTVTGHIQVINTAISSKTGINAMYYTTEDEEGDITHHYTGFSAAIDAGADAVDDNIYVYGTVTVIESGEIPAELTVTMDNRSKLVIDTDVTLTVANGAILEGTVCTIDVNGTFTMENVENIGFSESNILADVIIENLPSKTWTTLANALAGAQPGDKIVLNQKIVISEDTEIPAGVEVYTNVPVNAPEANAAVITIDTDATLTVNGTLTMDAKSEGMIAINGEMIVNGQFSAKTITNTVDDYYAQYPELDSIAGAHFALYDKSYNAVYITSINIAANTVSNNSNLIDNIVTIKGSVSATDATFAGVENEAPVIVKVEKLNEMSILNMTGATLTLSNAVLDIASGNRVIGTVATENASFTLSNAAGLVIEAVAGEEPETTIQSTGIEGTVTLATGSAVVDDESGLKIGKDAYFGVASGATLTVETSVTTTSSATSETFVVDGTIVFENGATATAASEITVNGTMEAENFTVAGIIRVTGDLNVAENRTLSIGSATPNVYGTLILGDRIENLGSATTGAVSGTVSIVNGYILAYNGADLSAANIDINAATQESNANITSYVINGQAYATVYMPASASIDIYDAIVNADGPINLVGWDTPVATVVNGDSVEPKVWYAIADFNPAVDECVNDNDVGEYATVYAKFAASEIGGTISKDAGIILTIDDLVIGSNGDVSQTVKNYPLSVGTHIIAWSERTGYNIENVTVTFNGQAVENGGTITITADMQSYTIVAQGAVPGAAPGGDSGSSTASDDGMGLTDYLLIVLVILIVVMAIMVAVRLMRS